jgi:predicted Na+-dependent transporter
MVAAGWRRRGTWDLVRSLGVPENVRHGLHLDLVQCSFALGVVMFGLGLSLTLDNFRRVGQHPKAVVKRPATDTAGGAEGEG